jgi:hypothetical protein
VVGGRPQWFEEAVTQVVFSTDGRWIATRNRQHEIRIREAASGRIVRSCTRPGQDAWAIDFDSTDAVLRVAWSNGHLQEIACGSSDAEQVATDNVSLAFK